LTKQGGYIFSIYDLEHIGQWPVHSHWSARLKVISHVAVSVYLSDLLVYCHSREAYDREGCHCGGHWSLDIYPTYSGLSAL